MMFEKVFHSRPLEDRIFEAMRSLKFQHVKLEKVSFRLRQRDRKLFAKCTMALKQQNKDRALIFANESAEVRKLITIIVQTQLVIERVVLRLETIKELHIVMVDLKPALGVLQNVTQCIDGFLPDVSSELGKVNDAISETLAVTSISSPHVTIPLDVKTPGGEKILEEVSALLEQRLKDKLPEPPISVTVTETVEPLESPKQMVALTTGCSEVYAEVASQTLVEMKPISFAVQRSSSLEDALLDYVKRNKGQVDVNQCALELNVSSEDVEKTLEDLGAQKKIRME
ncbi:MAG: Snf7 family protein [Candidatus Bathyarchaeota archaeon]|nr:MAG: Snf7 family protein [Candidatus Bathyarchaeota archaeon]